MLEFRNALRKQIKSVWRNETSRSAETIVQKNFKFDVPFIKIDRYIQFSNNLKWQQAQTHTYLPAKPKQTGTNRIAKYHNLHTKRKYEWNVVIAELYRVRVHWLFEYTVGPGNIFSLPNSKRIQYYYYYCTTQYICITKSKWNFL